MKRYGMILLAAAMWTIGRLPVMAADEAPAAEAVSVTVDGDFVSVVAKDATVQDVLDKLKENLPVELDIPEAVLKERVTLDLKDVSYEKVIEAIAGSHALVYERVGDGYRLVSAKATGRQDFIPPTLDKLSRSEKRAVAAKSKEVADLLAKFGEIFSYAGEMDYEQAKALIADRKAKVDEIVKALAALGPGGARAMSEAYAEEGSGTQQQLAMIEALGLIEDEEASDVLGTLYAGDDRYSLQREVLGSLARRTDAESEAVLTGILASEDDKRLRAGAASALGGRATAVPALASLVASSQEDSEVKQEAVHAIGRAGTEEAKTVLTETASAEGNTLLRKTAIQELARSYGSAAVPQLEPMLKDPDEAVRQSAIRALGRIGTPEAFALIQNVATSDASSIIRAHAEATLTQRGAAATPIAVTPN